jgi:hypothetical protein
VVNHKPFAPRHLRLIMRICGGQAQHQSITLRTEAIIEGVAVPVQLSCELIRASSNL